MNVINATDDNEQQTSCDKTVSNQSKSIDKCNWHQFCRSVNIFLCISLLKIEKFCE